MSETAAADPFSADDFDTVSRLVIEAWRSGSDRDWSVPAGTLEWSCWRTADHTIDCVLPFSELHAFETASPADLVNGLEAVTTLLRAVIVTADPDTRAVIHYHPHVATGSPQDFAARGALEMVLHAHDVCTGLDLAFTPPPELCRRLRDHTRDWPAGATASTSEPWSDLLEGSGRARVT